MFRSGLSILLASFIALLLPFSVLTQAGVQKKSRAKSKSTRQKDRRPSGRSVADENKEPGYIEIFPDSRERLTFHQSQVSGAALTALKKAGEIYSLTYDTLAYETAFNEAALYVSKYIEMTPVDAPSREAFIGLVSIYRDADTMFKAWHPASGNADQSAALSIINRHKMLKGMDALQAGQKLLGLANTFQTLVENYRQRMLRSGLLPDK